MQKLAVVYFPKINLDEINSLREKYDSNYHVISPHITIVSPISEISEIQLTEHVENIVKDIQPFSIRLNGLIKTSDGYLLLLVKDGNEKIINLHDKIYSEKLAPYLPTDFQFVPHITLGSFADKEEAKKTNFDTTCVFDSISIIKGDGITPAAVVKTIYLHN